MIRVLDLTSTVSAMNKIHAAADLSGGNISDDSFVNESSESAVSLVFDSAERDFSLLGISKPVDHEGRKEWMSLHCARFTSAWIAKIDPAIQSSDDPMPELNRSVNFFDRFSTFERPCRLTGDTEFSVIFSWFSVMTSRDQSPHRPGRDHPRQRSLSESSWQLSPVHNDEYSADVSDRRYYQDTFELRASSLVEQSRASRGRSFWRGSSGAFRTTEGRSW